MLPRFHFSRFFLARFLGGSPKSPPRFYYPRFCFLFCFKSARRWKYKAFPPPTSALVWALSLDRSTIHARCPIAPGIVALIAFVCNLITVPRGAFRAFNSREMRFPTFLRYRFLQKSIPSKLQTISIRICVKQDRGFTSVIELSQIASL